MVLSWYSSHVVFNMRDVKWARGSSDDRYARSAEVAPEVETDRPSTQTWRPLDLLRSSSWRAPRLVPTGSRRLQRLLLRERLRCTQKGTLHTGLGGVKQTELLHQRLAASDVAVQQPSHRKTCSIVIDVGVVVIYVGRFYTVRALTADP